MDEKEIERKSIVFAAIIGKLTGAIDESSPLWLKAAASVKKASSALSELDIQGFEIIRQLEKENLAAEKAFARERADIMKQEAASISAANANFRSALEGIRRTLSATIGNINRTFQAESVRAEQDYQKTIAQIQQDGRDQIIEIRKNEQEQLRQLELEHNRAKHDLTLARDAAGLKLENERYEEQKSEIHRQAREAEKAAKEATKKALEQAQQQYAEEQEQRRIAYEEQLRSAREAAAAQEEEARRRRAEEIRAAKQKTKEDLAAAQEQYNEERMKRAQAAMDQIRDLGGALNAERELRLMYQDLILADADAFMQEYRRSLDNGGTTTQGSRASGGYVSAGNYRLHDREFVMTRETAEAAERMLGGRLTQRNLLSAMSGTGNQTVNIMMENGMTVMQLKAALNDAKNAYFKDLSDMIGGAG